MKNIQLLIAIMLLCTVQVFAQTDENKDTKDKKDRKISITFGDDEEDDDDHDHDDHDHDHDHDDDDDKPTKRGKIRMGMVDLGISTYLADDTGLNMPDEYNYMDQRLARSINLSIHAVNLKLGLNGKDKPQYFGVSTGVRFNLSHYSFENDFSLTQDQESFFDAINYDVEGMTKNRLYASYLVIPAMLEINTNPSKPSKSFNIAFGYTYNILLQSNQRTKSDSGKKVKIKDDFNLNKNIGMLEGRIGYGPLNFYVQYGLDRLFQAGKGPEVTPINFGVNIIPR